MRVVMVVAMMMMAACAAGGDEGGVGVDDSEVRRTCPQGPGVTYVSRNKRACSTVRLACAPGTVPFNNQCGCGCEPDPGTCPSPSDPNTDYISTDPAQCATILFQCAAGQQPFFGDCGCGCTASACEVGGCSGQLCYDPATGSGISTCEWREEYACYASATCERQASGDCGWTQTAELQACLNNP